MSLKQQDVSDDTAVRTFSGYVLLPVGAWFIALAFLPSPIIGG